MARVSDFAQKTRERIPKLWFETLEVFCVEIYNGGD